jgi:hypothetical protein
MALLAESLVEEWLNRRGFFTIRGVKHGVNEVDLLGIRKRTDDSLEGWHVEVQVSFRPVSYIANLTNDIAGKDGKRRSKTSAKARTSEEVEVCAQEWVRGKFLTDEKRRVRERLWPRISWLYHFVHAVVRDDSELAVFRDLGVECHPFSSVLSELLQGTKEGFSGSAGGDIAEIVGYYKNHTPKP